MSYSAEVCPVCYMHLNLQKQELQRLQSIVVGYSTCCRCMCTLRSYNVIAYLITCSTIVSTHVIIYSMAHTIHTHTKKTSSNLFYIHFTDSSESDDEAERSKSPPPLPPRPVMVYSAVQGEELSGKKNMTVIDPYPTHEEIFIHRQTDLTEKWQHKKALPVTRRKPPPKPPRNWNIEEEGSDLTQGQQDEIHRVVKRVSSIVDVDINHLYKHMSRKPHLQEQEPVTRKRKLSRSAEVISPEALGALPRACTFVSSAPSSPRRKKNSISSLIQKFEAKSVSPSPPLRKSPPFPKKKVLRQTQSTDLALSAPVPPPKPHFRPPPLPPRPLLSTGKHPPVIPPHTPAPLLPPKPPGSRSPVLPPRLRERSSSDAMILIHSSEEEVMVSPPIRLALVCDGHKTNLELSPEKTGYYT